MTMAKMMARATRGLGIGARLSLFSESDGRHTVVLFRPAHALKADVVYPIPEKAA